jgi:hypothetical protein
MKSDMKRRFACTSSAIAVALLAFSFSFAVGGSQAVRADELESLSPPAQDIVLVPAKDVQALEQRLAYLEEQVAALTESWQHINTHRLCVSDDSSETCITKPQLDAFLASQAHVAQADPSAAIVGEAKTADEAVTVAAATGSSESAPGTASTEIQQSVEEAVKVATATSSSEPAPSTDSAEVAQKVEEPEHTGSTTSDGPATEANMIPSPELLAPETTAPGDQP